jgi:lipoprotein-anchoring transpeptidase ErfK/SrfK
MRLAAALLVLLAWPVGAAAQAPTEPVIPPGAKAAGLDIGNLTLSQAAAKLDARFGARMRAPVKVRVAGHQHLLRPASIGLVFDALKTARRANRAALGTPPLPDGTRPVDVPLHVKYGRRKLAAFTVALDRATRARPRNARVRITLRHVRLRHARLGWSIDERTVARRLDPVVTDPHARRILRVWRRRVPPRVNAHELRVPYRTVVTIDRAHFRLRLFKAFKKRRMYDIAVGMPDYPTPTGRFTITNKAIDPVWSAPDRPWAGAYRNEVVTGGSPENPLKARWLGITNGVGIHGTDAEYSIGTRASHGCIRMRVPDVKDLYRRVPVGTPVLIR